MALFTRLVRYFCTLSVVFHAASSAAQDGATAPLESVRFCAYNVKNWLLMDRDYGAREAIAGKPAKEKAAVIAAIKAIGPDILGLSEVGTLQDVKEIQAMLKAAGLHLPHLESMRGADQTRSLGLLSRFPIIARDPQAALTYRIGDTVFPFQRGILDVTIQIQPDFIIRALGVHLKSMRPVDDGDQALMRRNEAYLVRKHIDSIFAADPKVKLLAYGDFNEHAHLPAIDEIKGARSTDATYMHEVQLRDLNGDVWTHFWNTADSYSRLDYFFVSTELRHHTDFRASFIYTSRDYYEASDHRPIVLGLRMKSFKKD
jgi:endonuclease/exonuclease/phosphatase family metal-dependent hydrolase